MELDPVNISPLPAGMMLSFANRGHQEATAEGRNFSSRVSCASLSQFLQPMGAPVSAFQCGWLLQQAATSSFPNTAEALFCVQPPPSTPREQISSKFYWHSTSANLPTIQGSTASSSQRGGRAPSWVHCLHPRGTGYSSHLLFLHSLQSYLLLANLSLHQSPGIVNNSPY